MKDFLVPRYQSLAAYVPGEQPRDAVYVKLNTNESPFPPSPRVKIALTAAEIDRLSLYSDPEGADLRDALAAYFGYERKNILLGNGSDEILAFAFFAFCADAPCAFPDISYGFYPVYAALCGAQAETIPLSSDFTVPVERFCGIGKTVILANPNAPTGIALTRTEVERIVASNPDHVVLIDEAYVDFGAESAVGLVKRYDNLVIARTYSKSRSMAGARLGFAVASEPVIAAMNRVKYSLNPYNINRLTLLAGIASLADEGYFRENLGKICAVRETTAAELTRRGFTVLPSRANFLFATKPGTDGAALCQALRERGILVRHFDAPRIREYLRITIGTAEQMQTLLAALDAIFSA